MLVIFSLLIKSIARRLLVVRENSSSCIYLWFMHILCISVKSWKISMNLFNYSRWVRTKDRISGLRYKFKYEFIAEIQRKKIMNKGYKIWRREWEFYYFLMCLLPLFPSSVQFPHSLNLYGPWDMLSPIECGNSDIVLLSVLLFGKLCKLPQNCKQLLGRLITLSHI